MSENVRYAKMLADQFLNSNQDRSKTSIDAWYRDNHEKFKFLQEIVYCTIAVIDDAGSIVYKHLLLDKEKGETEKQFITQIGWIISNFSTIGIKNIEMFSSKELELLKTKMLTYSIRFPEILKECICVAEQFNSHSSTPELFSYEFGLEENVAPINIGINKNKLESLIRQAREEELDSISKSFIKILINARLRWNQTFLEGQ